MRWWEVVFSLILATFLIQGCTFSDPVKEAAIRSELNKLAECVCSGTNGGVSYLRLYSHSNSGQVTCHGVDHAYDIRIGDVCREKQL